MRAYRFERLSDRELLRTLIESVGRERAGTAEVIALIAEVDTRQLYLPAGCSSMFAYCVENLHLSEDAALKRIRAARTARQFPALFAALADGRLHLSGIVLLASYLTRDNAAALLEAAAHKTRAEVEEMLARRFPRSETLPLVQAVPHSELPPASEPVEECAVSSSVFAGGYAGQLAPGPVGSAASEPVATIGNPHVPGRVSPPAPRPKLAPVAPGRFVLQLTIDGDTHEMLRRAQGLLGHQIPPGDLAEVLKRSLTAFVKQLEQRRFAATSKPRPGARRRPSGNKRHIPAHVKRAVWQRDGARCTFVGENGHRCTARRLLEFDHVEPVARGGQATVENVRLRCRAHNQYEAEHVFGAGFMQEKRDAARRAAANRRVAADRGAAAARTQAVAAAGPAQGEGTQVHAQSAAEDQAKDVMAALRGLGFRAHEARRAEASCAAIPDVTLEERVRAALKFLCPPPRVHRRIVARQEAPS